MSRRTALSVSSSAPAIGNGQIQFPKEFQRQEKRENRSLSMSLPKLPDINNNSGGTLNPDELFTRHIISEVKIIQQRLRADADAKQEELRLMVGERYRDLLQASTSIISIADSSQHVQQALEEMNNTITSQKEPPPLHIPSVTNDAHLHVLQLLSAHIRLLLDVPEHLWRLIEKKKYFQAAWLFLLARVVHRSLVRDGEQDEATWSCQGIDMLEQFPLIQRQWDTVSPFRSQIIHKATISLREYSAPIEDACATLLTLHLLDSRPLAETLSVFLVQRLKALDLLLSWRYDPHSSNSPDRKTNGHVLEQSKIKGPINEIREVMRAAWDTISGTIQTAQSLFQGKNSQSPLMRRVLEYIQSDSHTPQDHVQSIPTELCLTTQTLLTALPSSTQFLLLPSDLRSYRPYIDLNSPSSSIHHLQFTQKVDDWFHQSSAKFQTAVRRWFSDLQNVKEVWSIRLSTREWILMSDLGKEQIIQMTGILDDQCRNRMSEIWKLKLEKTLVSFENRLNSTFLSLNDNPKEGQKKPSQADLLFQAPPLPVLSQITLGSINTPFEIYKGLLRKQIIGRTSLLNDVLVTLEACAQTIRQDFTHVMTGNEETRELLEQLEKAYTPDADVFCANIINTLESTVEIPIGSPPSTIDSLIFLGQISEELSSSPFILEIGCQPPVVKVFRTKTATLHSRIIDRWRSIVVPRIVQEYHLAHHSIHPAFTKSPKSFGPSSHLVQALLILSNSIQELGVSRNRNRQPLAQTALYQFITDLVGEGWEAQETQSLHDLALLRELAILQGAEWNNLSGMLEKMIEENLLAGMSRDELNRSASEFLARIQTLVATLLPKHPPFQLSGPVDKFSALVPYGLPPLDQFQPAVALAKPTARFGLLLVDDT